MNTRYRVMVAMLLLAMGASAVEKPATEGAEVGKWTMDFDAARKVAAEKKVPLFLNFTGSDWCGWCKLMDKSVFSQEEWQTYAGKNLMLVWIDFPKDASLVPARYVARNRALAEAYGVAGYPTYILLDDDGQRRLGQLGAKRDLTAARFIAQVENLLMDRPAAMAQLLERMPAEKAQRYRAADTELIQARADLATLEADYKQRSEALETLISAREDELWGMRTEARLAALPAEKAETYRARKARRDAVEKELQAWLSTKPGRDDESARKFKAWQDELDALDGELQKLLAGG